MPKRSPRIDLVNGPIQRAEERHLAQTEVISEVLVPTRRMARLGTMIKSYGIPVNGEGGTNGTKNI